MVVALLLSAVALLVLVWVAHVVVDLLNARQDYQFYNDVALLQAARKSREAESASQPELEHEEVG